MTRSVCHFELPASNEGFRSRTFCSGSQNPNLRSTYTNRHTIEDVEPHRLERTTEAIREVLSEMISLELEDPRLDGLEVVEVKVSPDKRHAYVALKSHAGIVSPETLSALEGARSYMKRELGQRLELHRTPELHFDTTANFGPQKRVDSLLKRIRKGRPKDGEEKPA